MPDGICKHAKTVDWREIVLHFQKDATLRKHRKAR